MILNILQVIEDEHQRYVIEQIYHLYYVRMKAYALKILNNEYDAEDAAMETFEYMAKHPEHFEDFQNQTTVSLIFYYTRCAAIDIYRKNKKRNEHSVFLENEEQFENLPDLSQNLLEIAVTEENKKILARAIHQLSDIYRTPVLLKYYYHMKNTEIADFVRIDVNTVNTRIHRAKLMLQKILLDMGYQYEGSYL